MYSSIIHNVSIILLAINWYRVLESLTTKSSRKEYEVQQELFDMDVIDEILRLRKLDNNQQHH